MNHKHLYDKNMQITVYCYYSWLKPYYHRKRLNNRAYHFHNARLHLICVNEISLILESTWSRRCGSGFYRENENIGSYNGFYCSYAVSQLVRELDDSDIRK